MSMLIRFLLLFFFFFKGCQSEGPPWCEISSDWRITRSPFICSTRKSKSKSSNDVSAYHSKLEMLSWMEMFICSSGLTREEFSFNPKSYSIQFNNVFHFNGSYSKMPTTHNGISQWHITMAYQWLPNWE